MTIGNELDHIFHTLGERLTRLEKKEVAYPIENDPTDRIAELVHHEISERINGDIAALESRVSDFEDDMNFDPDDLRCDFESQIEEVRDYVSSECDDLRNCISYESDRIDDIECYKITEEEARDIAMDVVRDEIGDAISEHINHVNSEIMDTVSEYVKDAVCEEINTRAVGFTEWTVLRDRVAELEARLNKPTLGACVLRWLREGPSAKELATKWYAGLRRARV